MDKLLLVSSLVIMWSFVFAMTTPPPDAIVVNPGPGALQKAIQSLGSAKGPKLIFLNPGTYQGNHAITYPDPLIIQGYSSNPEGYAANKATITVNSNAQASGGNSQSSALWVKKNNFVMYNVNVMNTFGSGSQAIALTAEGNKQAYRGCSFSGFQDTLYVVRGTHYFDNCNIEGAIDFIFGSGASWFEGCNIGVKPSPNQQVITANKRTGDQNPSMFVISKSRITSLGNIGPTTFLGRPWNSYAKVAFQGCDLPASINPAGWMPWDPSTPNTEHVQFFESGNRGPGSSTAGRKFLSARSTAFSAVDVLGSDPSSWFFGPPAGGRARTPVSISDKGIKPNKARTGR